VATIKQLRWLLSRLRQQRYYLEKNCERVGQMLPVCLIFRFRAKGTRDFQSTKVLSPPVVKRIEGKSYCYITYVEKGVTKHRYVRKENLEETMLLSGRYDRFIKNMAKIRSLNQRIVSILNEIGTIQMKEVKEYVKAREYKKKAVRKG
jgi:hypothetical protein